MPDIQVENHGSIFTFAPLTSAGREWLEHNTQHEPHMWVNGALAVEHRYAQGIAQGAQHDGLEVV